MIHVADTRPARACSEDAAAGLRGRIETHAPGYLYVHARLLRALAGGGGRGA